MKITQKVILFFILAFPLATFAQEEFNLSVLERFTGEGANDRAGWSVSSAGDVDGDGYDDLLVGAYNHDGGGANAGAAYLIYGQANQVSSASLSTAVKFTGEAAGDEAGLSVSSAGDVNGDGYDDIIIGAPSNTNANGSYAGAAYLIYGQSTSLSDLTLSSSTTVKFIGESADDLAGFAVSSAGDVDGDGYDDILIGAYTEGGTSAGAAYLIYGQAANLNDASLSTAVKFTGEGASDQAGIYVAKAGNINGDRYDDFLVGADSNGASDNGAAYLIYGQANDLSNASLSTVVKFTGEAANDYAGYPASSAGDVNNDGYDDFLIGASGNDGNGSGAGAAYLIYGGYATLSNTTLSASTAVKFSGESASDNAGVSVSSAGDVNNDGYDDLLIGANQNSGGGSQSGAAYLIFGQSASFSDSTLSSSTAVKFNGEAASDNAGVSVSSAKDVNNDSFNEIIIGATNGGDTNAGAAYLGYLYIDNDRDGIAGTDGIFDGTDCNDSDNTVSSNQTYYVDTDGDGYGSSATGSFCSSAAPAGYSTNSTDCSDTDSTVHANQTYYQDSDGDGLGNALVSTSVCSLTPPTGYVANSNDTDDTVKDVSTVSAGEDGDITITYVNNETSTIDVFSYTGTDQITLKQYQDNYYLALHPKAKSLALIDINALSVLSRKTLAKKSFPTNSLKTFTLRNKQWAVVTAKNKNNKVKLSLVKILLTQEKLGKKVATSLINKKIKPSKTKKNKNTILLRSKNNKIIAKYLLTKKNILLQK